MKNASQIKKTRPAKGNGTLSIRRASVVFFCLPEKTRSYRGRFSISSDLGLDSESPCLARPFCSWAHSSGFFRRSFRTRCSAWTARTHKGYLQTEGPPTLWCEGPHRLWGSVNFTNFIELHTSSKRNTSFFKLHNKTSTSTLDSCDRSKLRSGLRILEIRRLLEGFLQAWMLGASELSEDLEKALLEVLRPGRSTMDGS